MNNIKLNGYYIDVTQSNYNTNGRVNGSWRKNLPFSIDLNKKVVADGSRLRDSPDDASDGIYKPIGQRLGDTEKKFNSVVFSYFSMGKGAFYDKENTKVQMDSNGILLTGGVGVSLDGENEKNETLKEISQLFFQEMGDIKVKLNQANALSIGEIIGNLSGANSDIFGIEKSILETIQSDPAQFLQSYCQDSNEKYQSFKKFIVQMHSIFNVLSWQIQNDFNSKPAIILFIAKAYKEINHQRKLENLVPLEYFLAFQADFKGLESRIVTYWFKNCTDLINQEQFQRPSSLIFMVASLDRSNYEKSLKKKSLLKAIITCPFTTQSIYGTKGTSLEFCKSLLNADSIKSIQKQTIITLHINRKEPEFDFGKDNTIANVFDAQFINQLSQELLSNDFKGVLLYNDRCEYTGYYSENVSLPPATPSFDDSISNYYSTENTTKLNNYLNNTN